MTTNYHDITPTALKDINSNGILSYFEDERATIEDRRWFRDIVTSVEYQMVNNPISRYNWNKIKSAFARKYFPQIAPPERENKQTVEQRLTALLACID